MSQPTTNEVSPSLPPAAEGSWLNLAAFENSTYDAGRGFFVRALWYYASLLFMESGWLPSSGLKTRLLRLFGARIGAGLVIKPHVRIKYPWRLTVGNHCWIGQGVWIDNLADVSLGSHVCLSQLAYLCTGSHDHRRRTFDLVTRPIRVEDGAWVAARATLLPGVTIGANALAAGGSVVTKNVEPGVIVAGNPAAPVGRRQPPAS